MLGNEQQIKPLTSLRFFAATAVVLLHVGSSYIRSIEAIPSAFKNILLNGGTAVSFFFTLSGFILTVVYYNNSFSGREISQFFIARFSRIYPVYFLCIFVFIPTVSSLGYLDIPQLLLLQAWIPLHYNDGIFVHNWNGPAWTLSAEMFFYLAFPFLLSALARCSIRTLVALLISIAAIIVGFKLPALTNERFVVYPIFAMVPVPILRFPEFAYGAVFGMFYMRSCLKPSQAWLAACTLGVIAVSACSTSSWVPPVLSILFGPIIALTAVMPPDSLLSRLLCRRWLVHLGGASYALYLLHIPVHGFIRMLLGDGMAARLIFFPVVLGLSIAVFRFYEEPTRRWLRRTLTPSHARFPTREQSQAT
ncbi:putative Acyltransferase 3 [Mesorhizobium prunaredense]|uniref:Putative Acyltransferase 3 n=1 Tax=Mesorhizobium prunaredense TaxID=1631249 RepID=A0A1R3VE42_9HYPH|nr:acyltransferase [Mesorhizobium prunaredense]SIT58157.1 putative Acyltransferase 3 [Mesorhizobium prunaredense]